MPIIVVPYTDLAGFVKYLGLNHADLVYLDSKALQGRPFEADFSGPTPPPGFTLLYRHVWPGGNWRALYRVHFSSP
jgi:hypothetical protein